MDWAPVGYICGSSAIFFAILQVCQIGAPRKMLKGLFSGAKMTPKQLDQCISQTANRIMSSVHNTIQIPFGIYLLMDAVLQADPLNNWTPISRFCMSITAGYFLVDLYVCMFKFHEEGPLFLMHAFFSFTLFCWGVINNRLHFYGAAFLMWEISTPFVHLRWLLYKMGREDTQLYLINGALMILAFFTCRCVFGLYMSYDFWVHSHLSLKDPSSTFPASVLWFTRVANISLCSLNFYWLSLMLKKAVSVFGGSPPKQAKPTVAKEE